MADLAVAQAAAPLNPAQKTLIMPGTVRYELDLASLEQRDLAALAGRLGLKDEPAAEAALRWLSEQRGWLPL